MSEERVSFRDRLAHAWNAFTSKDQELVLNQNIGPSSYFRPDRVRIRGGNERSIINSIYTRIAIDVASTKIQHAKLDINERYLETIESGLNYCLNTEANIDQTGREFLLDLVISMCDEGVVAAVPVETTVNPRITGSFDIKSMRTAKVVDWYPQHVKVNLYNERTGLKEDLILPKRTVAIIQNPLYSVMNEPNSTLRRLIHKLNLLDVIDEESGSGKLDLIIQLPYVIKTKARQEEAERRRKEIETQLSGSKYGIAYTDGTERVTQLNRSVENKLMDQIEFLTSMLYSQLGLTKEVFEGTADERAMLNYNNRTIEPIVSAIADEFNRKFLTKTARTQKQKIIFFKDPFKLAPIESIANIGDSFTRNEILSPNEVRQIIGFKPSNEQGADELRNRNINATPNGMAEEQLPPEAQASEDSTSVGDTDISDL